MSDFSILRLSAILFRKWPYEAAHLLIEVPGLPARRIFACATKIWRARNMSSAHVTLAARSNTN